MQYKVSGTKGIEVATGRETEKDKKMALPDRQAERQAARQADTKIRNIMLQTA